MKVPGQRWIATLALCGLASLVSAGEERVTHVVKRGETLSGIAQTHYGDSRKWDLIAAANSLADPDHLREGQELVIPVGDMPRSQSSATTIPPPHPAVDAARLPESGPRASAVQSVQPPPPSAVALDSEAMRRLAAAAVVQHYTNLDLSAYDPGYLVRLESPDPESAARVMVSWLGQEALALEKGGTPDQDRKQVLKIEVWLTEDGRVLKVGDRLVWLNRNARNVSAP